MRGNYQTTERTASYSCSYYLGCHILTDGLNPNLDILNQQVELVPDKLQSVHLVLPVLQRCHSESPQQQQSRVTKQEKKHHE